MCYINENKSLSPINARTNMNNLKQILISITILTLILTGCTDRRLLSYEEYIGLLDSGMTVSSDNLSVASKGEVSLGDINVGSPKTITFTIKSTGESPLKITDLDLKGDSGFSLSGSSSKELAKGKTTTFSVTYSPSAIENGKSAVLTIKNNSPDSKYTITFKANGIPAGQTARPVFSIDSGSYTETQVLTLSCTTASSHIRYTTDGSDPSETVGTLYTGAITLSESVIIRAIAWSDEAGSTPSPIVEKSYSFLYSPTMSVKVGTIGVASSGIYDFGEINISSTPETKTFTIKNTGNMTLTLLGGATLNNSSGTAFGMTLPASSSINPNLSTNFSVTFNVNTIGTYQATISIPNNDGNNNPYLITVKGTVIPSGTCAAPTFNPTEGTYDDDTSVNITTGTPGASIRYTIDETDPTPSSGTVYAGPVTVTDGTTVVRAIAYKDGMANSAVTYRTYTVQKAAKLNMKYGSSEAVITNLLPDTGTCNFPDTVINNSSEIYFRITNTGTAPITISRSVTGTAFTITDVSVSTTLVKTTGTYTFKVTFAPTTSSDYNETLTIKNSSDSSTVYTVTLKGKVITASSTITISSPEFKSLTLMPSSAVVAADTDYLIIPSGMPSGCTEWKWYLDEGIPTVGTESYTFKKIIPKTYFISVTVMYKGVKYSGSMNITVQ